MDSVLLSVLAFVLLHVALNFWLTQQIKKKVEASFARTMNVIFLWVVPVLGWLFVYSELPRKAGDPAWMHPEKLPKGFLRENPPPLSQMPAIEIPGVPALAIAECLQVLNGIPVFNWLMFENWLKAIPDPADRRKAGFIGHRAWLSFMRQAIGPHCYLYETQDAIVLSSLEPNVIMASARFITLARKRIKSSLGELANFPPDAKSILLVFDDGESYQRYCAIYDGNPDHSQRTSGMFINIKSCPHFVTLGADLHQVEPTITHELVHSALHSLDMPLWLNEGIAVSIERRTHDLRANYASAAELLLALRGFWNERSIHQFWSGASFQRHDEGMRLSYELAHILVENLAQRQKEFFRFVQSAKNSDAGASAASVEMSLKLGEFVAILLDQLPRREWEPGWAGSHES